MTMSVIPPVPDPYTTSTGFSRHVLTVFESGNFLISHTTLMGELEHDRDLCQRISTAAGGFLSGSPTEAGQYWCSVDELGLFEIGSRV